VKKPSRKKPFAANLASRKLLEADGWIVGTVEQTVRAGKVVFKRDLFGFADLLAISPTRKQHMLVQSTAGDSMSNFNARVKKVNAEPLAALWLASGGRIQIHGWVRRKQKRELVTLEIENQNKDAEAIAQAATVAAVCQCGNLTAADREALHRDAAGVCCCWDNGD
jgi:hypothetical protein